MNSASPLPEDEDDPHAVTSPLEILSILRAIEKNQTLIRVHATRPNSTIVTTLLELRPEDQTIVLDNAPQDGINQRLIAADGVVCEASLDSVNIRFHIAQIHNCTHDNRPALYGSIPTQLSRIQRRDAYRISTPIASPVLCQLTHNDKALTLTLDDISTSGLGAFDDDQVLDLSPGHLYQNCSVNLPGVGDITVGLRVAYSEQRTTMNGKIRQRIGFSFENPSRAVEMTVQRYVSKLERDLIAKKKGFA